MAQKLVNTQIQEQQLAQVQQQRLNAQQVMFVRMLEMPLTQYEEYVKTEIDENPALEPDIQENSDSDDRYDGGEETGNSNEDIDAAIETVMAEFGTWDGCTMKKIAYSDDETSKDDLEYCNSLREEGTDEYDQAMVLVSSFHSPSAEKAEGTAWEPDTDYNDYTWHLARTANGEWKLLTWGYE